MDNRPRTPTPLIKNIFLCIISIVFLAFIGFMVFQWNSTVGFIIIGVAGFLYFAVNFFTIPVSQKIEIKDKSISFLSPRDARTIRWEEINGVRIEKKTTGSKQENRIILDVIENYYTKKENDKIKIYPLSFRAEAYGYSSEKLEKLIKEKLIQPGV